MNRNRPQILLAFALAGLVSIGFICAARAQSPTPVGRLPIAQLQKLAESGDPAAENELGVRYGLGFDVEKNPTLSMEWFHKAAKQGYGRALFNIGAASYNDDSVAGTRRPAMYWFLLAEDAGDVSGKEAVAHMQSEMSSTDLNATYVLVGDGYEKGADIKRTTPGACCRIARPLMPGMQSRATESHCSMRMAWGCRGTMWKSFTGSNAVRILATLSLPTIWEGPTNRVTQYRRTRRKQ